MMNKLSTFIYLLMIGTCLPNIFYAQAANDDACNAIEISLDAAATTVDNTGSSAQTDEVAPPVTGIGDACVLAWCEQESEVQNSIWFTFVAPESGAVMINTCVDDNAIDTQIAIWQVEDCANFESFSFIAANDDMEISCDNGNEFSSLLNLDGLTAGETYYVQIDGYDGEEGIVGIEILSSVATSRVNLIHNSGDQALSTVDIRINGELIADDLDFQTCTGYITVAASIDSYITINPADSEDDTAPFASLNYTFNAALDYVATVTGIYSSEGYAPAQPLTIAFFEGAQLFSQAQGTVDVLFFHGVTDAPTIDLVNAESSQALVNDLAYGSYSANGYVVSNGDTFSLMVTDEDGNDIGLNYCVPLNGISDFEFAFTVVLSGFITPANNSNGSPASVYFVNHFDGTFQELQSGLCPFPDNDDLCDAMSLTVNDPPVTVNNLLASVQENESSTTNLGGNDPESDCLFAWCDGSLDNSLWFTFTAPPSGAVTISTCFETTIDTQVALCEVGNCNDFGTVTYLAANDDMEGGCTIGNEFASELIATNLTPGNVYHIQTDGWEAEAGEFQIQVTEFIVNVTETQNSGIQFYPNPANDFITILGAFTDGTIEIRDLQGKLLINQNLNNNRQVSLDGIASGVYTISLFTHDTIKTEKLIKK
jgi:hypothetical protein